MGGKRSKGKPVNAALRLWIWPQTLAQQKVMRNVTFGQHHDLAVALTVMISASPPCHIAHPFNTKDTAKRKISVFFWKATISWAVQVYNHNCHLHWASRISGTLPIFYGHKRRACYHATWHSWLQRSEHWVFKKGNASKAGDNCCWTKDATEALSFSLECVSNVAISDTHTPLAWCCTM